MAATLTEQLGVEPELIRGDGGVFEVVEDGKVLFSKKESGRFPEDQEILQLLQPDA